METEEFVNRIEPAAVSSVHREFACDALPLGCAPPVGFVEPYARRPYPLCPRKVYPKKEIADVAAQMRTGC